MKVVPTVQVTTPEVVQVYTSPSSKQGLLESADVPYTSELKKTPTNEEVNDSQVHVCLRCKKNDRTKEETNKYAI